MNRKTKFVFFIELVIASVLFIGAKWATKPIYIFFQSYFADIFLPFGFYFLLSIIENEQKILKNWWIKGAIIFISCAGLETVQSLGIYALGLTFDPIDYLAYFSGISLAIIFDKLIFKKIFSFWRENK